MSTTPIDLLTADFYETISFKNGEIPDNLSFKNLFFGNGIMINNGFADPIHFTAESFIQALEAQIADGSLLQFTQREINAKTEIFGKVAQRSSVYEYTFADYEMERLPRGINYIQYVQVNGHWKINSMVWNDENELYQIPVELL